MGQGSLLAWEAAPVLRHLSPEEWQRLESAAQSRSWQRREMIVFAGESWPYLLYTRSGEIQVQKLSQDGRSLIPITLRSGDFFWGRPLFEGEVMPVSLQASAPSETVLWSYRHLLPPVQGSARALWDLLGVMSTQMLRAADYLEDLAFYSLSSRLARLVLNEFEPSEGQSQSRNLTLDQMAGQVGTNREVVCRLLHHFESEGFLELTRTELVIVDLKGLRRTAGLT